MRQPRQPDTLWLTAEAIILFSPIHDQSLQSPPSISSTLIYLINALGKNFQKHTRLKCQSPNLFYSYKYICIIYFYIVQICLQLHGDGRGPGSKNTKIHILGMPASTRQRHFSQFLQGFCVTEFHFTGADPGVEGNVFKTEATTWVLCGLQHHWASLLSCWSQQGLKSPPGSLAAKLGSSDSVLLNQRRISQVWNTESAF